MFIMVSVFVLDIITVMLSNKYEDNYKLTAENFSGEFGNDRIHFLNTDNSDAILLESDGHFAMIDAGEGSFNPQSDYVSDGFEDEILSYLKKVAGDADGKIVLDFILATHYHYDHSGGFYGILSDESVTVKRAYLKEINVNSMHGYERDSWNLPGIYTQLVDKVNERGIEIVSDIPAEPFAFGSFTIEFFNTEVHNSDWDGEGENNNSIGTKITKGNLSAFLAGDISNSSGLEDELAPLIGDVDLLKIGHHGYAIASSSGFVKTLNPEIAIVTNWLGKIYPNVTWNFTMYSHSAIYSTVKCNGIAAAFTDSGEICLTKNLQG